MALDRLILDLLYYIHNDRIVSSALETSLPTNQPHNPHVHHTKHSLLQTPRIQSVPILPEPTSYCTPFTPFDQPEDWTTLHVDKSNVLLVSLNYDHSIDLQGLLTRSGRPVHHLPGHPIDLRNFSKSKQRQSDSVSYKNVQACRRGF